MLKSNLKKLVIVLTSVILVGGADLHAACVVRNSNGQPINSKGDPLFSILQKSADCPENVQNLKALLNQTGLTSQPYMVANRGIHNPAFGSFSFFEQVKGTSPLLSSPIETGEFFFGHFTGLENHVVVADQEPTKGKLLVELIAWDKIKNLFNFYELIGTGLGAQWFYRGDSANILAENALLYLNPQGPKFGSTLRCSACHISGGPIMKEMVLPHNDWWRASRPLNFGQNSVSGEISNWVEKLGDASDLSRSVQVGINKLETSTQYQKAKSRLSLRAALRPIFCEMEINLESDLAPLDQQERSEVKVPSASLVNPTLASDVVLIKTADYQNLLELFSMQFPETERRDADHAWLVPVKGYSDLAAIASLIEQGTVTEEFVADVLAIDFEHPLFSSKRCGLLSLVPLEGLDKFPDSLKSSSAPGAGELLQNLTDPSRNKKFHQKKAMNYLTKIKQDLQTPKGRQSFFKNLIDQRQSVFNSEISKNPRGQIFEPGFRVIFPQPNF